MTEIESVRKQNTVLYRQTLDLLALKMEYELALQYYADPDNWSSRTIPMMDRGDKARKVLNGG